MNTRTGRIESPHARPDHTLDLSGYALYPGLVNSHDHLELNHFPRTRFREVYANAHQWGAEVSQRLDTSPFAELRGYPLWQRCFIGGMKNLVCGVTMVVHHNPLHRPLKHRDFPVGVWRRYGWAHSLRFTSATEIKTRFKETAPDPFMIHLAEGTDAVAQAEFGQLQTLGVATPRTVLIHGVGMTPSDQHTAIKNGCSLVWCPSTNEYLLNTIADITLWARAKRLLLGSDSRLTATGDLLDELRTAYATGQVSPQALLGLVTRAPYEVLGVDSHWDFRPGAWADIIALPIQDDPWLALVEARRARLSFILRHGRVMLADPPLGQMWPHFKSPASITLDNHPKLLDKRVAEKLRHADLQEPGLVWS